MSDEQKWDEALKAAGHTPVLNEDGRTDFIAYAPDGHNGPRCTVCDEHWCMWCTPADKIKPCDGGVEKARIERLIEDDILAKAEVIRAKRAAE